MKTPRIVNAIGHINDDLVSGANRAKAVKKKSWLKWGSFAACFTIMLMAVATIAPMMFNDAPDLPIDQEGIYEKGYFYGIDAGDFSTYVGGKVIAEDKIGNKISDASVTAGWRNAVGEWTSETEKLRGEVYTINGISKEVAVALKFIDEGEAVTTTHYYVIMNPDADLFAVEDYVIKPDAQNNFGDEMVEEIVE